MSGEKPNKTAYGNQQDALEKFREFILPRLQNLRGVQEAEVWGSLANGNFGVYEREHRGHVGSDIDLVVLLEPGATTPETWKSIVSKSWFDGYRDTMENKKFRNFPYQGRMHKVDLIAIKRNQLEKAKEKLFGKTKKIYLKPGAKKEL